MYYRHYPPYRESDDPCHCYCCVGPAGPAGPAGATGPTGPAGPTGPTGPGGVFSAAYAGVVSVGAQTVGYREAVQFVPPVTEIQDVAFNGIDLFTITVPGNYYCMAFMAPAASEEGPISAVIGLNGPDFGLYGSNYGTAAGQQVVCFGFTGFIPAGTTLGLYNASRKTVLLGSTPGRLAIFRIS